MKTLLLMADRVRVAVHLTGDSRLHGRTVKRLLRVRDVRFIAADFLTQHGLKSGTVNPWNVPFCRYHLLCLHVLRNVKMATNDGTRYGGQFFRTEALFDLPNLIVGFFGDRS